MKTVSKIIIIMVSVIFLFVFSPLNLSASELNNSSIVMSDNDFLNYNTGYMYIAAVDNADVINTAGTSSDSDNASQINWHKVLGWSTLGMMAVTISTGFFIPESGHCTLAGVTTGLAAATCVDGIYEYGGLISLTEGDWKYNTHAILGVLATAGFVTTLALADGGAHVATGIASGAAFTISLGVIYF